MSSPISPIRLPADTVAGIAAGAKSRGGFDAVFRDAVSTVERLGAGAADGVQRMLSGEGGELHQVAVDAQKAQLAFELFLQVRNKVVDAYQEVMRSQI
jgi:flagellar hook-basal body complex protein FliE